MSTEPCVPTPAPHEPGLVVHTCNPRPSLSLRSIWVSVIIILIEETSQQRNHCRKPQPIKIQNCVAQSQWIYPQNIPTLKAQRTLQKRIRKLVRVRELVSLFWGVSPSNSKNCTHKISPTQLPNMSWARRMPTDMFLKWTRKSPWGLNTTQNAHL